MSCRSVFCSRITVNRSITSGKEGEGKGKKRGNWQTYPQAFISKSWKCQPPLPNVYGVLGSGINSSELHYHRRSWPTYFPDTYLTRVNVMRNTRPSPLLHSQQVLLHGKFLIIFFSFASFIASTMVFWCFFEADEMLGICSYLRSAGFYAKKCHTRRYTRKHACDARVVRLLPQLDHYYVTYYYTVFVRILLASGPHAKNYRRRNRDKAPIIRVC